jgi:tetratricopeptide (TPR) repeat protein
MIIVETQEPKRIYPKNPIGIIALFVFFIEAISTVSLKFLLDSNSPFIGYIVAFIIFFPVIIILLFFITLWVRRESLYSPADFKDDASFVKLFAKMERLEAKQEATQVDPRDETSQALPIIQNLLNLDEIQTAINLGKAFLKVERYASSQEIFEYIEARIPASHEMHPKVLAKLAYSLIGQQRYQEAIKVLQKARREIQSEDLGFWPTLGLAYSYLKVGDKQDCDRWLAHAKSMAQASDNTLLVIKIYPEFKGQFQTNLQLSKSSAEAEA